MGVQYCNTGGLASITCVLIYVKHRINFVENLNSRGEIPKFGGKAILRKRKAGVQCSSKRGDCGTAGLAGISKLAPMLLPSSSSSRISFNLKN